MKQNDTIFITGANGMLGRAIVGELKTRGFESLLTPTRKELDLENEEAVHGYVQANRPDYVFHLASVVYGLKGNLNNQLQSLICNTKIYANVLTAFSDSVFPKKIFFAGTVASYAYPFKQMPLVESSFFDGLPHSGEFGYAMAKRHAYAYLELLKEKWDVPYVYGLFTNLYGENDTFDIENGHVIPSLICKAVASFEAGKNSFQVWGNQLSTRDFLYIRDAASAAVECMLGGNGIINICSGASIAMEELAETISSALDHRTSPVWDASEPVGIQTRAISAERLNALGFRPQFDLSQGIANSVRWYKENRPS
jgi:GDP-L-fucose synthase